MNWIGVDGELVLHLATTSIWDGMILSQLLPDGVDRFDDGLLCKVNICLDTPLSHYLRYQSDPLVVDLMMDTKGVVLTMQNEDGQSPLHRIMELCAERFNLDSFHKMKQKMREIGIETRVLKLRDDFNETALHFALKATTSLLS